MVRIWSVLDRCLFRPVRAPSGRWAQTPGYHPNDTQHENEERKVFPSHRLVLQSSSKSSLVSISLNEQEIGDGLSLLRTVKNSPSVLTVGRTVPTVPAPTPQWPRFPRYWASRAVTRRIGMEWVGFALLLWLIVGFLVALVVNRAFRRANKGDDKPCVPMWCLGRRIEVRRACDRGIEVPWHRTEQRHGFGRRQTDRPRKPR